jgi:endonuclease G
MYAVIVPNQDGFGGSVNEFAVTVDEVELRSGLDFFSELADGQERELESSRALLDETECGRVKG